MTIEELRESMGASLIKAELVDGRPEVGEDEVERYRAREGRAPMIVIGIFFTFVPPFIWGPLIIAAVIYMARLSGVVVTDRRLFSFHKNFRPGKYSCLDIPLGQVKKVKVGSLARGGCLLVDVNIFNRLLGVGDVVVTFEDGQGVRIAVLSDIKKPKALVAAVEETIRLAHPKDDRTQ